MNLKKRRKRDDTGNKVDSVSDGQNLEKKRKKKKKRKSGLEKKSRGEKGNDADSSNCEFFLAFIFGNRCKRCNFLLVST